MSEAIQEDSDLEVGTPESAAEQQSFDLGGDLDEDLRPSDAAEDEPDAPAPSDSEPAEKETPTAEFDPDAFDWLRGDLANVPQEHRWRANFARTLRGESTRATQALREQEKQYKDLVTQMTDRLGAPQDASQQDPYADLRGQLGPEQAQALEVVREVIKREVGARLDALDEKSTTYEQALQMFSAQTSRQQVEAISQQVMEARQAYGADLDSYADQITALVKVANPATQRPYTVKQAYELVSGKAAQIAAEMDGQETEVRQKAARATRRAPVADAASDDGGEITDEELLTKVSGLFQ